MLFVTCTSVGRTDDMSDYVTGILFCTNFSMICVILFMPVCISL